MNLYKKYKILIVEDDNISLKYLKDIFQNYNIVTANNFTEVIQLIKEIKIDLLITDIDLNENKNGIDLIKELMDYYKNKLKVICLTGMQEIHLVIKALNLNVDDYILKPINPNSLISSVNKILKAIDDQNIKLALEEERLKNLIIESKKNLIKDVSHHWRNPLSSISMIVSNIKEDIKYDELDTNQLSDYCDLINDICFKLSHQINYFSLQFLNKNNKEYFTLNKENFIYLNNNNSNIEYFFNINGDLYGEKSQLLLVFHALIKNAIEAIEKKDKKIIIFNMTSDIQKEKTYIEIKDNGDGFTDTILNKIGEPFISDKFIESGTGLSLFICKNIIEKQHHGILKIKNEKFTTIEIEIPYLKRK